MKKAIIDTNIISAFMRGNPKVIRKIEEYLEEHVYFNNQRYYLLRDNAPHKGSFKRCESQGFS